MIIIANRCNGFGPRIDLCTIRCYAMYIKTYKFFQTSIVNKEKNLNNVGPECCEMETTGNEK